MTPAMENNKEKRWLSASGIEVLETCSFKYWTQIIQKVPQKPNVGSLRGSIAHTIFELLLDKRHKKHVDIILQKESVEASKAVTRLLIKMMKADNIYDTLNYDLMNEMILVGLKRDFYGESCDGKMSKPEYRFELENQDPPYRIRGYIDKFVTYSNGLVVIRDFKSSKSKFSKEDLLNNNQALTYSLVGYKQLNAKDVKTEFLFLRFPKQPMQEVHPNKSQLGGFEHYLSYLHSIVENFDEKASLSNFAGSDPKNSWLCKRGSWRCPYLYSFTYWALVDEKGATIRTAIDKASLKPKEGQSMVEMHYDGCPFWKRDNDEM